VISIYLMMRHGIPLPNGCQKTQTRAVQPAFDCCESQAKNLGGFVSFDSFNVTQEQEFAIILRQL
jgi:hypothetical protein